MNDEQWIMHSRLKIKVWLPLWRVSLSFMSGWILRGLGIRTMQCTVPRD